MKMPRWNRKQKIVRNFLAVLLLLAASWAAFDFVPLTYHGILRQGARMALLNETPEFLYGERQWINRGVVPWMISNTAYGKMDGQIVAADSSWINGRPLGQGTEVRDAPEGVAF